MSDKLAVRVDAVCNDLWILPENSFIIRFALKNLREICYFSSLFLWLLKLLWLSVILNEVLRDIQLELEEVKLLTNLDNDSDIFLLSNKMHVNVTCIVIVLLAQSVSVQ
jgi:hypothetical protein